MEMMNDDNETSIILNIDENVDDLKYYAGTSNILKYQNPPIPSRQLSSLTMSNFDAYENRLKTFKHWPHSLPTVWGQWNKFLMAYLKFHVKFQDSSDNNSIEGNDKHWQ
jgi:hypothetical protein